jgi:hypothetical protein
MVYQPKQEYGNKIGGHTFRATGTRPPLPSGYERGAVDGCPIHAVPGGPKEAYDHSERFNRLDK